MDQNTAAYWINKLNLIPHPEGGFYREQYRSPLQVNRAGSTVERSACTSIYYLLEGKDFSAFHRLQSDEMWYFHTGSPLHVHAIDPDGILSLSKLSDQENGLLSLTIPANFWFASEIPGQTGFALVSCAVAPGFEFSEFEMAQKSILLEAYPDHEKTISRLCR